MTNLSILSYGEIRTTPDERYSVFDTIEVLGNKKNPRQVWSGFCKEYTQVVQMVDNFQFPGAGQRPTPVTDKNGILYIIGLLPGAVGHAYRHDAAQTMLAKLENGSEVQTQQPSSPDRSRLLLPVEETLAKAELYARYLVNSGCDRTRCALMGLEVVLKKHPEDALFIQSSKDMLGYGALQENIDYNPSELAAKLSEKSEAKWNSQQVNLLLERNGYQTRLAYVRVNSKGENKDEWRWELTELGKEHAIVKPASAGRWNGPQIRWLESIFLLLLDMINPQG